MKHDRNISQLSDSQVVASATESHVFGAGIEGATMDTAMHLHAPASHTAASQQAAISVSHGDLSHTLSKFYLEMVGINIIEHLPPSIDFFGCTCHRCTYIDV